jgi:hypothetical protein
MPAKKAKNDYMSVTSGNMTFAGTSSQVNKMLEKDLSAAIKRQNSKVAKENALPKEERRKLSKERLAKLKAEKSKTKQKPVKTATPSFIKTSEGKFTITKTKTGKIKITNPKGKTVTVPRGTNVAKIAFRGGGAGGAFLENLK